MSDEKIPEGFTRWDGGECPVPGYTVVDYMMRDGKIARSERADRLSWGHPAFNDDQQYAASDIIA